MEGYHLEYIRKALPKLNECSLIDKAFDNSMLKEFVDLFDSSYYKLYLDNGWQINNHTANEEQFHQRLNDLNEFSQVRSFWLNNELVGAYIFEENYITDFVVKPIFKIKVVEVIYWHIALEI